PRNAGSAGAIGCGSPCSIRTARQGLPQRRVLRTIRVPVVGQVLARPIRGWTDVAVLRRLHDLRGDGDRFRVRRLGRTSGRACAERPRVSPLIVPARNPLVAMAEDAIFALCSLLIPITIVVAVLHHRLYDIDTLVN